jgi:apolipoprotein N-acyltransferase
MAFGPALAAALLSAAAFAIAFPPIGAQALAWIALVPLLLALRGASLARRLALAVVWSFAAGWGVGTWMPRAVAEYFDQPLATGVALFAAVTGLMAAPYYALFAALHGPLARLHPRATPLLAAAAWAGSELLRGRLLNDGPLYVGNSPWATFGASQLGVGPVVQVAALGGVYAISFVLACVNAAIAEAIATRRPAAALPAALVVACALGYGALALERAPAANESRATPIALVQANLSAASRWEAGGPARTLDAYARLTEEAFERGAPRIVFWPEAALTFFLEREEAYQRAIGRLLSRADAELVVGAPRAEGPDAGPPYRNSVYVVAPDGGIVARYDKQRLLPFMETFPIGIDLLERRFGRIRSFSPGDETGPLPTRAGAAGVLVCNEALLPHLAGARVRAGARFLVNPSNDSWVVDRGFAEHQLALSALRAVEQRAWLVRTSDAGPSAVVDPYGRVVARSEPNARAVLLASIGPEAPGSLYAVLGGAFGLGCLALALAAAALGRSRPATR